MKLDKLQSNGRFSETDERKTPAVIAIANPASDQLLNLAAQQPFFKGMSEHLIQLLADSIMEMRLNPGHCFFHQGDPANRFYLILEGKVIIESEVKELGMVPIRTLGPGDDLAWAWLFPPYRMHFSARAIEPTRAIFFYGTRLREKCEDNHELGYQLTKRVAAMVVRNLNATQQRLMEFTHASDLKS